MKDWRDDELVENFLTGVRGAIPLASAQLDVIGRLVKEFCPEVRTFLDLGCGDGILGRYIQILYPEAYGVYLDYSEPMISELQKKVNNKSNIVQEDYSHEGWTKKVENDQPFDLILSGFSIHHLEDPGKKKLYSQIHSLLNTGGFFLNLEHVSSPTLTIEKVHDDLFIDSIYEFQKSTKTREQVYSWYHGRDDKILNKLAPVEDQCNWLREIGFIHVDCFFKIFELALFGGVKAS
ncbi:MAG TPA: class I SAM-dependent methyltransferase [Cyclobacteriaceae bacterium]|nr:class I SAM-dependent methyltransferase [Cyclobacteriaceae bacterium]